MKNKKLIKNLKKDASRQIYNDIKKSVVKEIFKTSKKDIKKLKKQILKELNKELFKGKKKAENVYIDKEGLKEMADGFESMVGVLEKEGVEEELVENKKDEGVEKRKTFKYKGFEFDVDRMSSFVTDKHVDAFSIPKEFDLVESLEKNDFTRRDISNSINERVHKMTSMNTVPYEKNIVKLNQVITPSRKEEIDFFIEKLKEGIRSLGKGEKNVNYRNKKDEVYNFTYEKQKNSGDDFSLEFDLDLDIKTCCAKINMFDFNIDGFKFNKSFIETIDIVKVLELVGFRISKYINEISKIHTNYEEGISREDLKIEDFIFDKRILKSLKNNDISTYGNLVKVKDLLSLSGIGPKAADKIKNFIKI